MRQIKRMFNKLLPANRRERGTALILTLGILSLLLIICMTFAFEAQSNTQAAETHADGVRAHLLVESAVQRAISTIVDEAGADTANHYFLYPGRGFIPNANVASDWQNGTALTTYMPFIVASSEPNTGVANAYHVQLLDSSNSLRNLTPNQVIYSGGSYKAGWVNVESFTDTDNNNSFESKYTHPNS